MSTIDERIVALKFDNGQFEKGVDSTVKSLEKLEKSMDFEDSAKGLEALGKAAAKGVDFSKMASDLSLVASKFTVMGQIGLNALRKITDGAFEAGKSLLKSLTLDQISSGFSKYEQKTSAVQTIMAATGKTIQEVESELERLTFFTDETSYSFTDMVDNIGKFTSQGVALDKSVGAMQGIANWAAVSGQGINQAGIAMYNLAQTLGKGSVDLMNWKSIQNANMDTIEFKETVIATAKELGVLNKEGKNKSGNLVDVKSFAENLTKDEWFTSEVLLASLAKYSEFSDAVFEEVQANGGTAAAAMEKLAEGYSELSVKSFEAAQQAKSFTDVINATKDAVSSGWMNSFQLIFGDYEQAVVLWSDLAEEMWELFAESGEARNDLLKGWQDSGGRDDMIEGLMGIIQGIKNIKQAATDVIDRVFPPMTVERLTSITAGLKEFGNWLAEVTAFEKKGTGVFDEFTNTVSVAGKTLDELFSGKNLKKGVKDTDGEVKKLQERLVELGYDIGDTGVDGIIGSKTEAAIKKFQEERGLLISGIYDETTHYSLMDALGIDASETTTVERVERTLNIFGTTVQKVQNIFGGAMAIVGIGAKIFGFLGNVIKVVGNALKPFGDALLTIGSALGASLMDFNDWLGESDFFAGVLQRVTSFLEPFAKWVEKASAALLKFFGLDGGEKLEGQLSPFAEKWKQLTDAIDKSGVVKKVQTAFGKIKAAIVGLFKNEEGGDTDFGAKLKEKLAWVWDAALEALPGILEGIANAISWFVDFITPYVKKIPGLINTVKNFFVGLWESTDDAGVTSLGPIQKAFDWVKELYEKLKESEGVGEMITKVKGFFVDLWNSLVDFFKNLGGSGAAHAEGDEVVDAVVEPLESVDQGLSKLDGIWDRITSFLGKVGEGLKSLLDLFGTDGLLGSIAAIFGIKMMGSTDKLIGSANGIVKSATGVVDGFGGMIEAITKRIATPQTESLGTSLLKIAGAVAILAAVIFLIGRVDTATLVKGAIVTAGILVVLIGLGLIAKRLAGKEDNAKLGEIGKFAALMAIGIGVLAWAMSKLGTMDGNTMLKGGLAVAGIMVALALMAKAINGLKIEVKFEGLLNLAAGITAMIGVIALIQNQDFNKSIKGVMGLVGILLVLAIFGRLSSKGSATKVNVEGFASMATAVATLVGIIQLIGSMDPNKFVSGFMGLVAIMATLVIFSRTMGKTPNVGGDYKSLAVLVAVIAMLVYAVSILGKMDPNQALQGIIGLVAVMAGLRLLMGGMRGINLSSAIGGLIGMIGVAGLCYVLALAMNQVKDIETDKMLAFSTGVAEILLSFGIFTAITGAMSPAGVGTALLAILGLLLIVAGVIAALSWMGSTDWFGPAMDNAAAAMTKLGEMVGAFTGAMKGADAKAFEKSLSTFDGVEVDEEGIKNAIAGGQLMADFSEGLPDSDIGSRIADFLMGSKLATLASDMVAFGTGFNAFSSAMSEVEVTGDLMGQTSNAIEVAKAISSFSTGLPAVPLVERLTNWTTPMERLSSDMTTLATGFTNFAGSMTGLTIDKDLKTKTTAMIGIAKSISDFSSGLGSPPVLTELFGWTSPMEQLKEDMTTLSSGFKSYQNSLDGFDLDEGLADKTKSIIAIAKSVSDFSAGLKEPPVMTQLAGWQTPMEALKTDMQALVDGFVAYDAALASATITEGSDTKTKAIVDIAKSVSDFSAGLEDPPVMTQLAGWKTPMQSLQTDMQALVDGFQGFSTTLSAIEEDATLSDKTQIMLDTATTIASFTSGLDPTSTWEGLTTWASGAETLGTDIEKLASGMFTWGTAVSGMNDSTIANDTSAALTAAQAIAGFIDGLAGMTFDDRSGWEKFWGSGESSSDSLFGIIDDFGAAIKTSSASLAGVAEGGLEANVASAKTALTSITEFLTWISGDDVKINSSTWNWTSEFDTIMNNMGTVADKVAEFNTKTVDVDAGKFETTMNAIRMFTSSLTSVAGVGNLSGSVGTLKSAYDELISIFAGDTGTTIDPEAFLNGLDPEVIATKVTEASNTIGGAVSNAANNISTSTSEFNASGAAISEAITAGVSGDSGVSDAVSSVVSGAYSAGLSGASKFVAVGRAMSAGMAIGIRNGASMAITAAANVAKEALAAAKRALDSNSPSKKFIQLGEDADAGFAMGFKAATKTVADASSDVAGTALDSAKNALASFSSILAQDLDVDPVIKPVVDLSGVEAGAREIGGLMNGSSSFSLAGTQSSKIASSINVPSRDNTSQNGSSDNIGASTNVDSGLLLTGNTFNVRSDNDIHLLASELAILTKQGQRALGAPTP